MSARTSGRWSSVALVLICESDLLGCSRAIASGAVLALLGATLWLRADPPMTAGAT